MPFIETRLSLHGPQCCASISKVMEMISALLLWPLFDTAECGKLRSNKAWKVSISMKLWHGSILRGVLCLCLFVLPLHSQTGYRSIHVGAPVESLPFPCAADATFCEEEYDAQWIRVDAIEGKILTVDIIYSGETLHRDPITSSPITLAQAIRLHSLQPSFATPVFGLAKDRDGNTYGIVDVANDIVYHTSGISPTSTVETVSYLSPDAPVLATAALRKLGESGSLLLRAARLAKPYSNSFSPVQPIGSVDDLTPKALNRHQALNGVAERTDKVIGSGKMVLALIGQVSTWYEVDKDHPDATAKSEDLRKMNSTFKSYWRDLMVYLQANKSLLKETDLEVIPFDMKKEIESKMRQLKAMGFEE